MKKNVLALSFTAVFASVALVGCGNTNADTTHANKTMLQTSVPMAFNDVARRR